MSGTELSSTKLLAFVSDAAAADTLRAIGGVTVEVGDIGAAIQFLKTQPSPQVLLVEIPSAEAAPALLDTLADLVHPACRVIATGRIDTLSFYQWLLGLGIHEYLLAPFTVEQLRTALSKGTAAPAAPATPAVKKLIAVIGARGGVGATTIATNIAAIFASEQQLPTALVDLDPHFGSVALALDLEPGRGMRDALEKPDRVDSLFLDRVMIKPIPNLAILSAEDPLQETIHPQANAGQLLVEALAAKFPIIVVDLPRQLNPLTRHMLAHADHVLLVAEPHLIDLRDALRIKDYITEQLKRPAPHLILNREGIGGKQELSLSDFTKHYGASPAARIALLPEAMAASARGELIIQNQKLRSATDPLRQLAARISGVGASDAPAKKSSRLFTFGK